MGFFFVPPLMLLCVHTKVTVEPMVTVGQATKVLNPLGWTLACTLEIMDATIGGLCIAVGMTTHSHRVGLIQETVLWYGRMISITPPNPQTKEIYMYIYIYIIVITNAAVHCCVAV